MTKQCQVSFHSHGGSGGRERVSDCLSSSIKELAGPELAFIMVDSKVAHGFPGCILHPLHMETSLSFRIAQLLKVILWAWLAPLQTCWLFAWLRPLLVLEASSLRAIWFLLNLVYPWWIPSLDLHPSLHVMPQWDLRTLDYSSVRVGWNLIKALPGVSPKHTARSIFPMPTPPWVPKDS